MGGKSVTIHDVTRLAGVAASTVSTVLNNKDKYVSPDLRQRVLDAARKLNYRPNLVARSLKLEETKTIGLIFPNIISPVMPPLVHTAQRTFQLSGFDTFVGITDEDGATEKTLINSMLAKRVDGLIISPVMRANHELLRLADSQIPVVLIERCVPDMDCVVTDNAHVSYRAVRHLIDHGRRRIGLITMKTYGTNTRDRVAGYTQALTEAGLYNPDLVTETDFAGYQAGDAARELVLSQKVDAIFATSQSISLGAFVALKRTGRSIPDDVALFGYDQVAWMEAVTPALSTTRQPIAAIAAKACEILLAKMGGRNGDDQVTVVGSELVIRESCGCTAFPIQDDGD